MTLRHLLSSDDPAFAATIALYESSFPEDERIASEIVRDRLPNPLYPLLAIEEEGRFLGFAYLGFFEIDAQSTFVGFMFFAVEPTHRGHGIGAEVYRKVYHYSIDACQRLGRTMLGLIYEVERPELAENDQDRNVREHRLAFYERMGGKVLKGIEYVQPSLGEGKNPVPLHLMVHPGPEGCSLSAHELHRVFMEKAWDVTI